MESPPPRFAIETNLYALPGVSKEFAYFNDDFFLSKKHTHGDFLSPVYGSVVRMPSVHSPTIWPVEFPEPGMSTFSFSCDMGARASFASPANTQGR